MVDFAKEQVISPQRLAKKLGVSVDTVRRWMGQGLEKRKLGGKVFTSLEALNRFSGDGQSSRGSVDVSESMASLQRMGVNIGKEPNRDGNHSKTEAA